MTFQTTLTMNLEGLDPARDVNPPLNQQVSNTFTCGTPGAAWNRVTYDGTAANVTLPFPTYRVAVAQPPTNILLYNQPLNGVGVGLVSTGILGAGMQGEIDMNLVPGQILVLPFNQFYNAGNGVLEITPQVSGLGTPTFPNPTASNPAYIDVYVF